MKIKALIISTILSLPVLAGEGPAYSKLGIGFMPTNSTPSLNGMGGAGLALFGTGFLNNNNPTQWLSSSTTRIMSSFSYEGFSETGSAGKNFYSNINFQGFLFTFPIKEKMSIGLGISPYTQNSYGFITHNSISGTDYTTEYYGTGGLSKFSIGSALRLSDELIVGARLDYIFGTISKNREVNFNESTYSIYTESYELSGAAFSLSGHYLVNQNVWKTDDRLYISGTLDLPTSIKGSFIKSESSSLIADTTTSSLNTWLSLPFSMKIGIGYQQSEHLYAAVDFHYSHSSSVKFKDFSTDKFSDQFAIRAGLAYNPSNAIGAGYYQRMTYKAGLSFGQTNMIIKSVKQDEIGISGGVSLPLPSLTSSLDLAAEFQMRGFLYNTPYQDKIFKISVGINLSELWFQERIID